jgi:hypothetical protein
MRTLYNHAYLVALMAASLSGVGCTRNHSRSSAIVERVQEAGAGDVAAASPFSLDDWMRKHREIAFEVEKMCVPVRETADAQWGDTPEGRVCVAAHNAAMSTYRSPRDGKAYHGGNK